MILTGKKLLERLTKTNYKKTNQKEFRVEKVKVINYMLNGKATIVLLTFGLIKNTYYKWVNIFQNQII